MTAPTRIVSIDHRSWENAPRVDEAASPVAELEEGKVLFFPHLRFELSAAETALLDPALVDPKRKNISLNATTGKLTGVAVEDERRDAIGALVRRYYETTRRFLDRLLPHYAAHLHTPTTSLRLHRIGTWKMSWRKDDTRLHVDAFPSRPVGEQRILRVFNNINPHGDTRLWRVGEAFDTLSARYLPQMPPYRPGMAWLLHKLHITKSRSAYDHFMLQLHDRMKADADYQRNGQQESIEFPPGSTWICFSDQTPHAAMTGQFMLEQTYLLPVSAMTHPELSPQRVLERQVAAAH
ncbi:3-deoxy-D-manno-oct-2-ulosonic acid (Kdo) hydroxylase [Pigmentiphaga sp. NML080357]|uniref:Kdo hydroxylase family protein n=1 Tax=Pigmentiphaga sp. NML080357 TaxID=2008675 RepID=UPI000B40B963|nr:Kdo hydroxylase family protein [Pigmentiphaga sp. NML080357]OVZ59313.1 3-deoxy-D-manno-oct-2-ulosonic acid (Kdo) hydroxylase [Pigmentiphaga sp. NML080357]